jgi:2-polyprenyl-6-methoxyphenol hydroxylase-like FAD-dependent oxidoreductase
MRVVVVGAGPAGLFVSMALARRGHRVDVIDRDPGPPAVGAWMRKGVMQFHHAHTLRGPVVDMLRAELPDVMARLERVGAVVVNAPDGRPVALRCRRSIFDAAMWAAATREPRITLRTGHVSGLVQHHGRVTGVRVGDLTIDADVVLDASGRAGRFAAHAGPTVDGECGIVYATRRFRLHPGVSTAEENSPVGLSLSFPDYFAIAFRHDTDAFSITFAHDGSDRRLRALRHPHVFAAAVDSVPRLREWADPARSSPVGAVLPAGQIHNRYRVQADPSGRPTTPGLIALGDAVCTTTPLAGRGITLALRQATALAELLSEADTDTAAAGFDAWCTAHLRPWFDDHCHADADRARRWGGGDVDTTTRLPSDLIVATADVDDRVRAATAGFAAMDDGPASLESVEPLARAWYADGWRPPHALGPRRDELGALCAAAAVGVA